ncbi:EpsG family protein, partial [Chromatiaceae bacterium AAb-1]|nr:EpsG family protein [Chromatiaceae bacterium AAb-1]
FPNYTPAGDDKPIEALYALITLFTKRLGGGYYTFIFVMAVISLSIKFFCFKKMSNSFYASLLLYVAVYMTNDVGQIRNGFSSGLMLLGVYFLYHAKPLVTGLVLTSAMLVHLTASLSFLIYVVRFFSNQITMLFFLLFFFATAAMGGLGMKLVELLVTAAGLGREFRIIRYVGTDYAESYTVLGGTVLLHMLVAVLAIFFKRRLVAVNAYNSLLIPIYVYGFCLMLLFVDYGIVLARIKDLFCLPASMVLIPSFIFILKGNGKLVGYLGVMMYAMVLFFFYKPGMPYLNIIFN